MTLVLAVIIYAALFWIGFHVSRWARKSWYPRGVAVAMAVALCGAIGAVAGGALLYQSEHVNLQVAP